MDGETGEVSLLRRRSSENKAYAEIGFHSVALDIRRRQSRGARWSNDL